MSAAALRSRPIYGGLFGMTGRYALVSQPCVSRGLHTVRYMVVEHRAGTVLSVAPDKLEALSSARRLLRAAEAVARRMDPSGGHQASLWPDVGPPVTVAAGARRKPVSRRKRDIFAKCAGACHYCAAALTLDGKWHVEHMMPRALGGADEIGNLVAACVPCNQRKRDQTAVEFMTGSARVVDIKSGRGR